ncbi:MAG TPA: winged helix-turn-helix domain-containing protein [bacterium]|nr:winged helix-turn-helix domain-containing protein [bacterium]
MLAAILGGVTAERVLVYLSRFGEGYARGIARHFGIAPSPVQKQLAKFEEAGILASVEKGRTLVYLWNPRYPFLAELQALLVKAYDYLTPEEKERYTLRTRPRRRGKPA